MRIQPCATFLSLPCLLAAQAPPALISPAPAPAPDLARMKADLFYLAGPECQGRGTGQPGQRIAAAYIARRMRENGLQPLKGEGMGGPTPYHFMYVLERLTLDPDRSFLRLGDQTLKLGRDFATMLTQAKEGGAVLLRDPAGQDLKGKWVFLVQDPEEGAEASNQRYSKVMEADAAGVVLLSSDLSKPSPALVRIVSYLRDRAREERYALKGKESIQRPVLVLSAEGQKALGLEGAALSGVPRSLGTLRYEPSVKREEVEASDLAALIPGSDPKLKDEVVVVSAHHDHLGLAYGLMHPGADDNASGTVGILEVGRLLVKASARRSVLILSVSGEELGLFGSEAFLAHPPIPLARLKADINIDMIGREALDDLEVTPARVPGAVSSLTANARELAPKDGFRLRPDADAYWERSDHFNFFKKGIPAIFFFDGMTVDYHQPGDTPEKIDLAKVAKVVGLVRDLALQVADAPEAPQLLTDKEQQGWAWPAAAAAAGK